ncbi:hypothetical protein SAMD00023353_3200090 [Rosellinia necatrix]|uniref:Uncharacterized protein n=1 Tax=Rosellinia necatrix TaxID=77044 RepID=A0A1W2TIH6_ROSNE|nr:hypothetical protein SAMD00023353_3200090 [Rosellinia necatrix]
MTEQDFDPAAAATEVWQEVFASGPYTSFKMVEAVVVLLGISSTDILANLAQLKNFNGNFVTEDSISESPLYSTWPSLSGRCTSFAVKAVTLFMLRYPDVFDFHYYDVGRHRVARCERTGVLIGSSSSVGAVVLREKEEWTNVNGLNGRWKYINGISTYERNSQRGVKRATSIGPERAMGVCLEEVTKGAILVYLFRYYTAF